MSSMRDRQQGFERSFAMDEESKFKAMGAITSCSAYGPPKSSAKPVRMPTPMAKEVVRADFEEAGQTMFPQGARRFRRGRRRRVRSSNWRRHGRTTGDCGRADQKDLSTAESDRNRPLPAGFASNCPSSRGKPT